MAETHRGARDHSAVERRATAEAAAMGSRFFYSTGVAAGGVTAAGAMMLLQQWGNASCSTHLAKERPDSWLFVARFEDFDTRRVVSRYHRQGRPVGQSGVPLRRRLDRLFSAGQSIAMRDAICYALPSRLLVRCKRAAVQAGAQTGGGRSARVRMVERAAALGVDENRIAMKARKPLAGMSLSELTDLAAALRAIEDGWVSATDVFAEGAS